MADSAAALIEFPQPEIPAAEVKPAWPVALRVAFRFFAVYFGIYIVMTQMLRGFFPFSMPLPNLATMGPMRWLIDVTAANVFGAALPLVHTGSGSGDKTADWVLAFLILVSTAAITVVWSVASRRAANYDTAHKWFRLFLRFALATTMLSYGSAKLIPLQMPFPSLARLLEPYGMFSPMGVLWSSIGASRSYEMFTGAAEMAAAVLLFIPHTATLGALVSLACAIQIFTLNMTYDVPVKLFSFHLLLMSLFLLAPDWKRLLNVLVLNRPADVSSVPPIGRTEKGIRSGMALQVVFGLVLTVNAIWQGVQAWPLYGGGSPRSPLYGIWNVAYMSIDGVERAPLVTDHDRWRRLTFDVPQRMAFHRMDDTAVTFNNTIDLKANSLELTKAGDTAWKATFSFERPTLDHINLDGAMDGKKVQLRLERVNRQHYQLTTRGFSWVQEFPYNR